jgi:cobyrinic acid a,c-diamide synthase
VELIVAGDRSSAGKTTVTLALLAALTQRADAVQSFKVGPDYIDPMFHRTVTGRPCYNLDPVLTSEVYVQACYAHQGQSARHCLVEGVMGLFDGATGLEDTASTAHIARLLHLPVLLVVDCGRMSRSVAALVQGYRQFDPRVQVVGVVLNRVGSDRHLELLQEALAGIEMPILGVLRRDADITLPDRHLGLVPTGELSNFPAITERLAAIGQGCFDWEALTRLMQPAEPPIARSALSTSAALPATLAEPSGETVRIAIATDQAFNFYYPDNLAQLQQQGAILHPWSPLTEPFPSNVAGLYLGGGFPEIFAEALSANQAARHGLQQAITTGLPTYAECGGLMYLSETLVDFDGTPWPMVGALPTTVEMTGKLSLGYRRAIALQDSPLVAAGTQVIGHEFHRSQLTTAWAHPLYQSQRYSHPGHPQGEGWQQGSIHASYLHLHWGHRPELPQRFIQQCQHFGQRPA